MNIYCKSSYYRLEKTIKNKKKNFDMLLDKNFSTDYKH